MDMIGDCCQPDDTLTSLLSQKDGSHRGQTGILFIIDQLWTAGGAERALLKTIDALPNWLEPHLLTFKHNSQIPLFTNIVCPLYVFSLGRTYDINAVSVARKIRKLIRDKKIRIVHTFHETSDLWAATVAKASGCPVIVSSRRDMGCLRSAKHDLAYRVINKLVDKVITVSDQVKERCRTIERLEEEKLVTIYNGLDLRKVDNTPIAHTLRSELHIDIDDPIVVAVGNIRRIKGIDVLIRAASHVCRRWPKTRFVILGSPETDQEYLDELDALIRTLRVEEHFIFAGSRENIPGILKVSTIFCLPSRTEGFSNALIEAMACAVPCVATDVGGNSEAIVDGENGFLVPSEDAELMANRIMELLRDPERRIEMGKAARSTIERQFTLEAVTDKLVNVYIDLLDKKTSSGSEQLQ